ncbi:MAG: hypothetical protein IAE80_26295 [Anaerolinea sp.]|nr:hypothetical protein [Anaerolinea sp.]
MAIIFGAIMIVGLAYLLLMIFGSLEDPLNVDSTLEGTPVGDLLGLESAGEATGLGCSAIAAFLAGFGAVGLTGTLLGWNGLFVGAVAVAAGGLLGRGVVALLGYVYRQQSTSVYSSDQLIGMSARVTIDSPAGRTGEVIVENDQILKYPVQEINGSALHRNDIVEVVDVEGRFLRVKKKHSSASS